MDELQELLRQRKLLDAKIKKLKDKDKGIGLVRYREFIGAKEQHRYPYIVDVQVITKRATKGYQYMPVVRAYSRQDVLQRIKEVVSDLTKLDNSLRAEWGDSIGQLRDTAGNVIKIANNSDGCEQTMESKGENRNEFMGY